MNRIRVLIIEMPQLMTDIVKEIIARQPDIELAGIIASAAGAERAVRRGHADVVLCQLQRDELPAVYRALLETCPRLRLLAIDPGDRTGSVYELRPTRSPLDVWPEGLVDAIRAGGASARQFRWTTHAENQ